MSLLKETYYYCCQSRARHDLIVLATVTHGYDYAEACACEHHTVRY